MAAKLTNNFTKIAWVGLFAMGTPLLSGLGGPVGPDVALARPSESVLPTAAQLESTCSSLTGQTIAGVTITATVRYAPAIDVTPVGLCKISGSRAPFLDIEVVVPDNWSGRVYQVGGGGYDGFIPSALKTAGGVLTSVDPAVAEKSAVFAASNGGNRAYAPAQAGPAVWLGGSSEGKASLTDYAYASLGTTVKFAKGVAKAFYGSSRTPTYTYFSGCSNGGREAYAVAQRWPEEYSGIVSGCETMETPGQTMFWLSVASKAGTPAAVTNAQYKASYASAVAACDSLDGIKDDYLENAATCKFDPALLQCGLPDANADPALCLSAAQVQTLRLIQSPLRLKDGTIVYSGLNWSDYSGSPYFALLGGGFAAFATNDAAWLTPEKQRTFNIDRDYPLISAGLRNVGVDHDIAAIASFVASGKKLISYHAIGDNLLSADDHIRNFTKMTDKAKQLGMADPLLGARMFMVPVNTHGGGNVDWLNAIIDWTEKGIAPTQLTLSLTISETKRTLPVCLIPKGPKYNGTGDKNLAASYSCS